MLWWSRRRRRVPGEQRHQEVVRDLASRVATAGIADLVAIFVSLRQAVGDAPSSPQAREALAAVAGRLWAGGDETIQQLQDSPELLGALVRLRPDSPAPPTPFQALVLAVDAALEQARAHPPDILDTGLGRTLEVRPVAWRDIPLRLLAAGVAPADLRSGHFTVVIQPAVVEHWYSDEMGYDLQPAEPPPGARLVSQSWGQDASYLGAGGGIIDVCSQHFEQDLQAQIIRVDAVGEAG